MLGHLLTDDLHLFTALGTFAFFFTEFMLHGVGLDVLGKLVKAAGLLLARNYSKPPHKDLIGLT